ncbi:hypothetical protein EIQ28_06995 [Xanthomonas campestris pv. plantaginis]
MHRPRTGSIHLSVFKDHGWLSLRPNYYWTAEMRCCAEYLRSLALCEWRKTPSSDNGITRWLADSTVARLPALSSKDASV